MKKKFARCCLLLALLLTVCALPAAALDMGPKPSVVIDFPTFDSSRTYYVTLLSQEKQYGPWSTSYVTQSDVAEDRAAFQAFQSYTDPDGFYFIGYFDNCTESNQFRWGYYPPKEFKVLVYFPDTGEFIASPGSFTRYAFDSYFTAMVSANTILLKKDYQMTWEIISFLCRCVITIAIEIGIGWLFMFRSKELMRLIVITNTVTQILLNVLLNITNYQSGPLVFQFRYAWLELCVFAIEAVLYTVYLRRRPQETKLHPVSYAFCSNLVSFIAGMLVAKIVPGIF